MLGGLRLRSRIAMIDSLALAQEVGGWDDRGPAPATSTGCIGVTSARRLRSEDSGSCAGSLKVHKTQSSDLGDRGLRRGLAKHSKVAASS